LFTSNITFVYQGLHQRKDLRLLFSVPLYPTLEADSLSPCSVFVNCKTLVFVFRLIEKQVDSVVLIMMLVSHKELFDLPDKERLPHLGGRSFCSLEHWVRRRTKATRLESRLRPDSFRIGE